jgi:hypothetical protein
LCLKTVNRQYVFAKTVNLRTPKFSKPKTAPFFRLNPQTAKKH